MSRKKVFDHPRMQLVEDRVELPNGTQAEYLRQTPSTMHSVAVIAINTEGKILVQQEYAYPVDEVLYQLPGGSMEHDEDPATAAIRELSEESGYTAADCETLGFVYCNSRRSDQKQYVVVCKNLTAHQLPADPEEFIESVWLTRPEIDTLVAEGSVRSVNMLAALQLFTAHMPQ